MGRLRAPPPIETFKTSCRGLVAKDVIHIWMGEDHRPDSALSAANTCQTVTEAKEMKSEPTAGLSSASMVDVRTGSINVSTRSPPGLKTCGESEHSARNMHMSYEATRKCVSDRSALASPGVLVCKAFSPKPLRTAHT